MLRSVCLRHLHNTVIGSIPEKDPSDGSVYNTSTVYSPQGAISHPFFVSNSDVFALGELVAIHRKVHLFDIDIPGKIKFKVGYIHSFFTFLSHPDSGKRDTDWWLVHQLFRYGQGIFSCFRANLQLIFASRVRSCRAGYLLRCALPRACDDLGAPR